MTGAKTNTVSQRKVELLDRRDPNPPVSYRFRVKALAAPILLGLSRESRKEGVLQVDLERSLMALARWG